MSATPTPTPTLALNRQQFLAMVLANVPTTSIPAQLKDHLIMAPNNMFIPVFYTPTFTVPPDIYTTSSYSTAVNYFQNLLDTTKFPIIPRHGMIYMGNDQIVIFQFGANMWSSPPPLIASATPRPLVNSILYNSTGLDFKMTPTGFSTVISTSLAPKLSSSTNSHFWMKLLAGLLAGLFGLLIFGCILYYFIVVRPKSAKTKPVT